MRLTRNHGTRQIAAALLLGVWATSVWAADQPVLAPVSQRFAAADVPEVPSFQKHVVNLFGRLGCNGRACHGSFQGRGGFRLSLFGYDFQADHEALFDASSPRVDLQKPQESLIIAKPTDADLHEGGQRYAPGSWQHHVLLRWIEAGAKREDQPQKLVRLEVTPAEILFQKAGDRVSLRAVAVWEGGVREDVTPLCRFQTNNASVAQIDETGLVTAADSGDTHVVVSYDNGVVPVPVLRPFSEKIAQSYPRVPTPTKIDELVVAKLAKLGIVPSELCSDAEFLRRVRLDMTGTLPTPQEVREFLSDTAADKRARKIDALLKTPEYAAWWTTRLCDFTGNNYDQLNNVTPTQGAASQEWYDWIYQRVAQNVPYDELVEGIVTAVSRRPNQSYLEYCRQMSEIYQPGSKKSFADLPGLTHFWARQDLRDVDARVIGFAYSFLGTRIECAQCHKHPFDQWSKQDFDDFKRFFAGVTANQRSAQDAETRRQYEELIKQLGIQDTRGNDLRRQLPALLKQGKTVPFPEVFVSAARPAAKKVPNRPVRPQPGGPPARLLGGDAVDLSQEADPRARVMAWLRDPENRFFAPAFVNRVWAAYFNVGIIHPPDDSSLANPPSNQPLLDHLAQGFIASGYDMKWVHREIANSRTYQLSWRTNETNAMDEKCFSHAIPRRMPAEVLYDAVRQASSSDEQMVRLQADVRSRAIAIPGSGARSFRNRGDAYALTIFGRSTRDSNCDCNRSMEPSLLQTVYLKNDQDVLRQIDVRQGGWVSQVAARIAPRPQASSPGGSTVERERRSLQAQLAPLEARLRKLRNGGDPVQTKKLEQRLAALRKQLADLPSPPPPPPTTEPAVLAADLDWAVEQTYLRVLNRYPDDPEKATAREYLVQSANPVEGTRDLLWALLNTKEFMLNH